MVFEKKYTAEEIAGALARNDGMVYKAAEELDCTPKTIYVRLKKNEQLQQIKEHYDGLVDDEAESQLKQAIEDGEPWAVQFRLKHKAHGRGYAERKEISGPGGEPIQSQEQVAEMTAEEAMEIAQVLVDNDVEGELEEKADNVEQLEDFNDKEDTG